MNTVINLENSKTKQPLFFGDDLAIQRYDKFEHPLLFRLFKNQVGFFWRPEEIDLSGKEALSYQELTEQEKWVFTKNLMYQILLDSVQSRGIPLILQHCSNLELEAFGKWWESMETLHSYSYTYIIKAIYPDPAEVFDKILEDEEVRQRAITVTKQYDKLLDSFGDSLHDKKKELYLTLISVNILEGIRFYVSFACSYALAENKKMTGSANVISLINRDENLHLGATQYIINKLNTDENEGFIEVAKECEDIVRQMYKDAAEEEIRWAEYLFSKGSILGLNAEILTEYMKHLTNRRAVGIKIGKIYPDAKNPIPWIDNWTNSNAVQAAPQETEIINYKVGEFKQDLDGDFGDFKL